MMADESDDCRDVVRYWEDAQRGLGCRLRLPLYVGAAASSTIRLTNYSSIALFNLFLRLLFRVAAE